MLISDKIKIGRLVMTILLIPNVPGGQKNRCKKNGGLVVG